MTDNSWFDILRRTFVGINRDEVEEARREYEHTRVEKDQDLEEVRRKLREIGRSPDPLAALVRALRGEEVDVHRRTH